MALHTYFEGAKYLPVLEVLIFGVGGGWRFLTWVLDLNHRSYMAFELGCVYPEVFIGVSSVEAKIHWSQFSRSSDKL